MFAHMVNHKYLHPAKIITFTYTIEPDLIAIIFSQWSDRPSFIEEFINEPHILNIFLIVFHTFTVCNWTQTLCNYFLANGIVRPS